MRHTTIACMVLLSGLVFTAPNAHAQNADEKPEIKKESGHEFHGMADYYHHSLYGKKTASGQLLAKEKLTAAHRTLPFGTRVYVLNKRTGRSCVVVINDRGPFTKSKVIDLSHAAADQIGLLHMGTAHVACTVLPKSPGKTTESVSEKISTTAKVASTALPKPTCTAKAIDIVKSTVAAKAAEEADSDETEQVALHTDP